MATVSGSKPIAERDSLKIAIAVAFSLFRSRRLGQQSAPPSSSLSDADVHRWKTKAKERKRELISLREELKEIEEGRELQSNAVPQIVSCRCHFFDGCGLPGARKLSSGVEGIGGGDATCNDWIDDVLRRRFLRHVRWRERQRRIDGSIRKRHCIDLNDNNEMEWLCTSVDFLLELCGSNFSENDNCSFASLSHQAMDSILVSLKKSMLSKKDDEIIEDVVHRLLTCLLQRMSSYSGKNETDIYVHHLIRKLGEEPYIGQRAMLLVSQKISSLADSLLVTDPFDDAFPDMHDNMFMMMQLTEFIISDNLHVWTKNGALDSKLFEEWLRSIAQARKALGALENRNGLYLIYLERITGATAKQRTRRTLAELLNDFSPLEFAKAGDYELHRKIN